MILKGIGASDGKLTGTLKFYEQGKVFSDKDILVANSTTPEMSLEMLAAGAVITEHGGMLSHASIFCREIKKPCVVGVKDLLIKVSDGATAIIDGGAGTLELKV